MTPVNLRRSEGKPRRLRYEPEAPASEPDSARIFTRWRFGLVLRDKLLSLLNQNEGSTDTEMTDVAVFDDIRFPFNTHLSRFFDFNFAAVLF